MAGFADSDLPQGPDFARLEAPMVHYGLNAFRHGDFAGLEQARNELELIARDESRPGDDKCSRESVINRDAGRFAAILGMLGRLKLLNTSEEEERFVYFEAVANALAYKNVIACGVELVQEFGELLPANVPRPRDPMTTYYFKWREELSEALGADAAQLFAAASRRLAVRGFPLGRFR